MEGRGGDDFPFRQMAESPVASPYDNSVTLLYKWAQYWRVPVRMVLVRRRREGEEELPGTPELVFAPLPELMEEMLREGDDLATVYETLRNEMGDLREEDVAMSYYEERRNEEDPEDLRREINAFYSAVDPASQGERFPEEGELVSSFGSWFGSRNDALENQTICLEQIGIFQGDLADLAKERPESEIFRGIGPPVLASEPVIKSVMVAFSPRLEGTSRPATQEDGYEIFDRASISPEVPFVQYNGRKGVRLYKVYRGSSPGEAGNYGTVVLPAAKTQETETLYCTLWLGLGDEPMEKSPRETFFQVVYNLRDNYLTIQSAVNAEEELDERVAVERVQRALPNLVLEGGREVKVRGSFDLWDVSYEEVSLLDTLLREDLFNYYLYVEESSKPFAFKKRFDVHYRSLLGDQGEGENPTEGAYISNSASVSFTLANRSALKETSVGPETFPSGTPHLHVNITRADSRRLVDEFARVFRLLFRFYLFRRQEVLDDYLEYIPQLADLLPSRGRPSVRFSPSGRGGESRIKKLRARAPDLFISGSRDRKGSGYVRRCQAADQPDIVEEGEIEAEERKTFLKDNREHNRQVMAFPVERVADEEGRISVLPTADTLYYTCTGNSSPYPGLKCNKMVNSDVYPFIPCCFGLDQMDPRSNSNYLEYLAGRPCREKAGGKSGNPITTNKVLKPGRLGVLPRAIRGLLRTYSSEAGEMSRYGVPLSPNALLACALEATGDEDYLSLPVREREPYLGEVRRRVAETTWPGLLRQELFDRTDEEISAYLGEEESLLDPNLFFRAVEVFFRINVYVFSPPPPGDEEGLGDLELPRFRGFFCRPPRLALPVLLVLRQEGAESDELEFPQCELIVDKRPEGVIKLFGREMAEVCAGALAGVLQTYSWFPSETAVFRDLYYGLDHLALVGEAASPVSQYVDPNGKMRALTLDTGKGLLTLVTIPSQPENLPTTEQLARAPAPLAVRFFGNPTACTRNAKGLVNGLWFPVSGLRCGEYVPVVPVEADLPLGPPNPLARGRRDITGRLKRLRRTLGLLLQVVLYLYQLDKTDRNTSPALFGEEYLAVAEGPVEDSATFYDLSPLPRHLPRVSTPRAAIRILERQVPALFSAHRVVMYSREFADKVLRSLADSDRSRAGLPPSPSFLLEGYYVSEEDFLRTEKAFLFLSQRDLDTWLLSQNRRLLSGIPILGKLPPSPGLDPYLFRETEESPIYLVQNVVDGERSRALAVARNWSLYRSNSGAETAPLEEELPVFLFEVSPVGTLAPLRDETGGREPFLSLLLSSERYAALLPVL